MKISPHHSTLNTQSPETSTFPPVSSLPNPLELLNLYFSQGTSGTNKASWLWRKMDELLSWENLLERGYQADMCPLLYYIITKEMPLWPNSTFSPRNLPSIVPDSIITKLRNNYLLSLKRNIILLDELKIITKTINKEGIAVVTLKGGYLAEHIYEDIACRPMGDLDILVSSKDRKKAYKIIKQLGFQECAETEHERSMHISFMKTQLNVQIICEIHHKLVKDIFPIDFDSDTIMHNGILTPEQQIVYYSWHMIRHGVHRCMWLCDVAHLLSRSSTNIDTNELQRYSKKSNTESYLFCTIGLLSETVLSTKLFSKKITNSFSIRYFFNQLFFRIQKSILNNNTNIKKRYILSLLPMKSSFLAQITINFFKRKLFSNNVT